MQWDTSQGYYSAQGVSQAYWAQTTATPPGSFTPWGHELAWRGPVTFEARPRRHNAKEMRARLPGKKAANSGLSSSESTAASSGCKSSSDSDNSMSPQASLRPPVPAAKKKTSLSTSSAFSSSVSVVSKSSSSVAALITSPTSATTSGCPGSKIHISNSQRWADIESDDEDDAEEEPGEALSGRAAKRQRQRLRRRLGRAEAAAARLSARDRGDNRDMTIVAAEEESREHSIAGAGPPLPKTQFVGTTPEFEQYRLSYRSFRLGNAAGAKGEVSATMRPEDFCNDAEPSQRLKFWFALDLALPVSTINTQF